MEEVGRVSRAICRLTPPTHNLLWSIVMSINAPYFTPNAPRSALESMSRIVRVNHRNLTQDQALELSLTLSGLIELQLNHTELFFLSDMVFTLIGTLGALSNQDVFLYLCTTVFKAWMVINPPRCDEIVIMTQSNVEY
jgi:hypothetical protein